MAKYPLEPLLTVRRRREDNALRAAAAAEDKVRAARAAQAQAAAALEAYRRWRADEVDRRYAAIMGQQLNRDALNSFKAGLAALGQREEALQRACEEAEAATRAAEDAAAQARAAARQASRDREKITEHKKIWCKAEQRGEERREEAEMEECATAHTPA